MKLQYWVRYLVFYTFYLQNLVPFIHLKEGVYTLLSLPTLPLKVFRISHEPNLNLNTSKFDTRRKRVLEKRLGFQKLWAFILFFSLKSNSAFFKPHISNKSFFNIYTRDNFYTLNLSKFLNRVSNVYKFLATLFYLNLKSWITGNKFFLIEVTFFNWINFKLHTGTVFLLTKTFFIKDYTSSNWIHIIFQRFESWNIQILFFLDLRSQRRNLFLFKKTKIFIIGLTPVNTNPWEVDYPLLTFSSNLFIQYLILKFFFHLIRYARQTQLSFLYNSWKTLKTLS